jgi:hypothetical protein
VNVSQWPYEKKPIGKVVHTQVAQSIWDHQVLPNFHAIAIYLKLIHVSKNRVGRFDECQCEDDDVRIILQTWVLGDGHYRWLKGPINSLPMEHQA